MLGIWGSQGALTLVKMQYKEEEERGRSLKKLKIYRFLCKPTVEKVNSSTFLPISRDVDYTFINLATLQYLELD